MAEKREGYRNLFTQLTDAAWDALLADASEHGQSVTTRLNELLHKHYRIGADKIPPRKPTGRKPKKK